MHCRIHPQGLARHTESIRVILANVPGNRFVQPAKQELASHSQIPTSGNIGPKRGTRRSQTEKEPIGCAKNRLSRMIDVHE